MVTAGDIITYIGIPLAVLGVLPTIYTCIKSLLTLRAVSRSLARNGVVAITRSALLSGIVEVEIPRRSLAPLARSDPQYFALRQTRSHLKGGSWTAFYWKEMVIGVKSYRIQYHDELAQPQAEMEFEALVAYLLDRGAVAVKEGWADLRAAGLWTPVGTRLLNAPGGEEAALWVALSDDSDGILSLAVEWREEWGVRGGKDLPPYWVRVRRPGVDVDVLYKAEAGKEGENREFIAGAEGPAEDGNENEMARKEGGSKKADTNFLDDSSTASSIHSTSLSHPLSSPIRIRISSSGVQTAHSESSPHHPLSLRHLRPEPPSHSLNPSQTPNTAGFWFSCGATALIAPTGSLWSFSIPSDILSLSRRDTIPGGIMVLLGVMTDTEVPTWRTPYPHASDNFEKHVKFMDQAKTIQEELRLPPDQRILAQRKRIETQAREMSNEIKRKRLRDEQRREQDVVEALQSRKLPMKIVAERNRAWLLSTYSVPDNPETSLPALIEQILFAMLVDEGFARRIAAVLDLWRAWAGSGGMGKSHFEAVKEDMVGWCLGSFLIEGFAGLVEEPVGVVQGDLMECLRVWRRVRVG